MSERQFDTFDDFIREFDKSAERRKKYREQRPYYDLIRELVELRNSLGITQDELAKRAGVSQSRISRIEAGEHDIQLSTLIKLAGALGCGVDLRFVPVYEINDQDWRKIVNSLSAETEASPADYVESDTPMIKAGG